MNVPRRATERQTRADCIEMLSTVLAHAPGSVRGTAVFMLHSERRAGGDGDAAWCLDDHVLADVLQRLAAAAPTWHRLLHGERGEFIVIAQGLVDGGAVLGSAARLVHAYDDALARGRPRSVRLRGLDRHRVLAAARRARGGVAVGGGVGAARCDAGGARREAAGRCAARIAVRPSVVVRSDSGPLRPRSGDRMAGIRRDRQSPAVARGDGMARATSARGRLASRRTSRPAGSGRPRNTAPSRPVRRSAPTRRSASTGASTLSGGDRRPTRPSSARAPG